MTENGEVNHNRDLPMYRREITLADGRYMIFYTFGDEETDLAEKADQGDDV